MNLHVLLDGLAPPPPDHELAMLTVGGLVLDSRQVQTGDAFVALQGSQQHGLHHAAQAIAQGAAVILYDSAGEGAALAAAISAVPIWALDGLDVRLGEIAARFYGQPSRQMAVIGITGTNGKTSCSQFLAQLLTDCGIIGTLGWGSWGQLLATANTTPDALAVQRMLASLQHQGKQAVAMEVSSHGLAQGRVNGVAFTGAVFTNITRDHLDYHGTMAAYLDAKLLLLKQPGLAFAVINLDAEGSTRMLAETPEGVVRWGVTRQASRLAADETLQVLDSHTHSAGLALTVAWRTFRTTVNIPLYGDFNAENVALVLAVLLAMGEPFGQAVAKLASLQAVAGRMECFGGGAGQPLVFVDYAHTPDALDNVLRSARGHCRQALWAVFGCGGNRDTGKRPLMGASAGQWADHVLVTDDNPRFEDSAAIIADILVGCKAGNTQVLANREQAIRHAISHASPQDCIVVAGKGHEDYQEIKGVRYPFSDRQVVLAALAEREQ
ncbi:UDP-N-acetylmuramoyl-L-alanyl-D-glutamate--2,6-diaminopimelate ligase [Methylovulum psychrotolerans]|uniref:UDP-N-acetylmuramoyl-L-alanyl-D-glutamate--2, 6-diaminopimelate ligase n=1 Tax=Methylovulum psychrotolerans TaxID=1704499 RepID=UPI001BFF3DA9|nr:UDP-N-acetylmuramoyl-L-alanyl-D-glutamate--2,6-diaminopimelate ligase [Methylovulum psychrotolerans]MBT9098928.1 UDP-N-acetylmuramoyl-L-alanyl-D-glutamate--2,6-diaminopimelate ligase [Methylovulum psychrotolerans]